MAFLWLFYGNLIILVNGTIREFNINHKNIIILTPKTPIITSHVNEVVGKYGK